MSGKHFQQDAWFMRDRNMLFRERRAEMGRKGGEEMQGGEFDEQAVIEVFGSD